MIPDYVVTGSMGGLGRAVVELLKKRGAVVAEFDRWADVEWNVGGVSITATEALRESSALIMCHGVNEPLKQWPNDNVWRGNYDSFVHLAKGYVAERLMKYGPTSYMGVGGDLSKPIIHRSAVVAITSNSASIPRSKSLDYCASKAAVSMALRVMQRDHALQGFEFYDLEAGHADTPMFERMSEHLGADVMRAGYERSPLKRLMQPKEMAEIIAFIVENPAAVWLSGSQLRLDGGEH